MANPKEGILLEAGTNEVEILEFLLNNQGFGINVLKIQAIEQHNPELVTEIPLAPGSVMGTLLFRNRTIPIIDLKAELGIFSDEADEEPDEDDALRAESENKIVLVTEFNNTTSAFLVDGVNRIHRIGWDQINPMSKVFDTCTTEFTGSVNIDSREILIVDLERIVARVLGNAITEFSQVRDQPSDRERSEVQIVLAEDSGTIRQMMLDVLKAGGYTSVTDFDNGKAAFEEIARRKQEADDAGEPLTGKLDLVISDIEMPQMDGLTMCRNIRQNLGLKLPVVMFSSMINEQMGLKCQAVGASSYISKPQFGELVDLVDGYCMPSEE